MIQRHLLRACFFCWRIQLDEPRWELLLNEKWRASLHLTVWCTKPYPSINAFLETRPDHLKTGLFGEYPRLAYAKSCVIIVGQGERILPMSEPRTFSLETPGSLPLFQGSREDKGN